MNKKLFVWPRHKPWSPFMFAHAKTVEEARQLITEELDAMYRMGYILVLTIVTGKQIGRAHV